MWGDDISPGDVFLHNDPRFGASHMADGYTRTRAGNIGVCMGTSGPAGTDMITGLYAAAADSVPILAITGQAPVARLHKEDFQAVDIATIAAPVTKMAVTVLEAAPTLGGRLGAWPHTLPDGTEQVVEHGFHAFFRQYYTWRAVLRRADPTLADEYAQLDEVLGGDAAWAADLFRVR